MKAQSQSCVCCNITICFFRVQGLLLPMPRIAYDTGHAHPTFLGTWANRSWMHVQVVAAQGKPHAGVIDGQAFLAKLQKKGEVWGMRLYHQCLCNICSLACFLVPITCTAWLCDVRLGQEMLADGAELLSDASATCLQPL